MDQGDGSKGLLHFRVARNNNAASFFYEETAPEYIKEAAESLGCSTDAADRLARLLSLSFKGEWLEESNGGIWRFGDSTPLLREPIIVGSEFGRRRIDECDYVTHIESVILPRVVTVRTRVCGAERTVVSKRTFLAGRGIEEVVDGNGNLLVTIQRIADE